MQRLKAGLTRDKAAALLRVSERTVRNWEQQRTAIPYAAYRLLAIEAGYELPGDAWRGFYLRGDTIWSPEGKAFSAYDLAWWSLTCELARDRLKLALQPQAATSQPVAAPPELPTCAADRRESTPLPVEANRPPLQSRPLSALPPQIAVPPLPPHRSKAGPGPPVARSARAGPGSSAELRTAK